MHLYILTRGIRHEIQRYIEDLSSQYFEYGPKDAKGNRQFLQLSVRPVQLFELVFPEEHLAEVVKVVTNGPRIDDWRNKFLTGIRLALKAEKIPKLDMSKARWRPVSKQNIAIYPIGIRKDKIRTEDCFIDVPDGGKINLKGFEFI